MSFIYGGDSMLFYPFGRVCVCVSQALGGLVHQALYQRILSSASTAQAQATCYAAILPLLIMGIPSVAIAATAASAGMNLSVSNDSN